MQEEPGHYANRCFKKQRESKGNLINEKSTGTTENNADSDTDEYEVSKIEVVGNNLYMGKKPSLMRVHTNGQEVLWQPDTDTQRDIWDEKQLRKFEKKGKATVPLSPTNTKLFAYGSKVPL